MIRIAPNTHETIAAGPASWEALRAPNSHPDPMIEPTLAKRRPTTPTCLLRTGVSCSGLVSTVAIGCLSSWSARCAGATMPASHLPGWGRTEPNGRWRGDLPQPLVPVQSPGLRVGGRPITGHRVVVVLLLVALDRVPA